METDFKVKVGEFEGPLEMLLDMIERRKLHISDVSLSQVADGFIEHIKSHEEFPMGDSADFILIASTLLLIKSKSLLPNLDLTPEEEQSIEDLENRLKKYEEYRLLASHVQKMFGNFLFFAEERRRTVQIFAPTEEVTQSSLLQGIQSALNNLPKKEALPKVMVEKVMSLEEMIGNLTERITASLRTSFKEFSKRGSGSQSEKGDKIFVIVAFLAMLELVKQGAVRVNQEKDFEDIEIESENVNTPTYG
jgi:segregation and condensation protein A